MVTRPPRRRPIPADAPRPAKVPRGAQPTRAGAADPGWTFLSNHAHVLLCIARDAEVRLRDLADLVGITERAAHRIVVDLEAGGYISRERTGRRNHYEVNDAQALRHPIERHRTAASLIALLRPERRKDV